MNKYIIFALVLFGSGCQTKGHGNAASDPDLYYTCSMDPQVHESHPGKCPICGMQMTPVHKSSSSGEEVNLSVQQIQLGNIHTDTVYPGKFGDQRVFTATVSADPNRVSAVSARSAGRIEKLYVQTLGAVVHPGDRLFDLFSDELTSAQREYLLLLEQQEKSPHAAVNLAQTAHSARKKLDLLGMAETQIAALEQQKAVPFTTPFYDPANNSGVVTGINVKEGDYVMEGATILQLADLSTLLVEAQVFASQLEGIGPGTRATVRFPDQPGKEVHGAIQFGNPEVSPSTRLVLLRLTVPNTGLRLKPGMPAYVAVDNLRQHVVSLPTAAVLRDSKSASVWIQTGLNTFRIRMVETGAESGDRVSIVSGLYAGDVVVVSGAYLLQSEYIFKNGADPMAGMGH